MVYFLLTAGLFSIIMVAMAVGVIFSNRELKGSCGGVGNCACEEAGRPKTCERMVNAINQHIPSESQ